MSAVFDLSCLSRTSVPESKLSHDRPSQPRFCRQNADLIRGKNLALRAKKHMSYGRICFRFFEVSKRPKVERHVSSFRRRAKVKGQGSRVEFGENVFYVFSTASAESWNKTVLYCCRVRELALRHSGDGTARKLVELSRRKWCFLCFFLPNNFRKINYN